MEILVGLVVLGVLGYFAKSYLFYEKDNPYRAQGTDYESSFQKRRGGDVYDEVLQSEYGLITALMAKVAKADGGICELENRIVEDTIDELSGYFSHKENARKILQEILENEERDHGNIDLIAGEFVRYTQKDPHKRVKIMEFLINLSFADKSLSTEEEATLEKIAYHFKLSAAEYEKIMAGFKAYYNHYQASGKNPYEVLGVGESVTAQELKNVYRRLVKEHHPDVIKGQGLGEDFVKQATAKLQEINEAYETIKAQKGY